jgi:predicted GNAT family N-acyltransferase
MKLQIIEHGSHEYDESVQFRDRMLRQPLGLIFTPEQLAAESGSHHIAGFLDGAMRACCVLVEREPNSYQVRQVAVDERFQRQGWGHQLMEFAEQHAASLGARTVFCHARLEVVPFYEQLGYVTVGEPFEEVTIMHVHMEKHV